MLVCICTQAAVSTADSTVMLPCLSLSLSHTHTHDAHYSTLAQISAFEQSVANTWTNNKTLKVADSEAPDCQSKVGIDPFCFFRNSLRAQPALYSPRFTKLSSIKCVAQIWTFVLCCSVVNQWFLIASTFGSPNKVLYLSHRNTQRLPDMTASTLLRLLKPRLLSLREHLGGITQIFPHCDVDMWCRVLMRRFSPVWISLLF